LRAKPDDEEVLFVLEDLVFNGTFQAVRADMFDELLKHQNRGHYMRIMQDALRERNIERKSQRA